MLKIIFFIKSDKTNKKGESPIYAKVTFKSKSTTISTSKSISKERWDFTNNLRNVLKAEKEKVLKQSLDLFALEIERKFNELSRAGNDVSLTQLKLSLSGNNKTVQTRGIKLLKLFDEHNKDFRRKLEAGERSKASLQKYERAKDLVKNFMKKQYNIDDINTEDINSAFVYNLESYLKYDSQFKSKKGIKNNSVVKYFSMFKTVAKYGIKMDLIDKNPFDKYEGKLSVKDAIYLTLQELNRIENKVFSADRLEKVKDLFLFSCYTGYAPVDASNLTLHNLFKDNNGDLWIMTNRAKTGIKANVPVLPPTQKIIDKYSGLQSGLLPKISNQKMNAYLKEIADVCEINKNLTWYVARHTFATTVTLANGIKIENVSSMLGHTNIKQTQHYAKVLDSTVMEDMMKLKSKFL